MKLGTLFSAPRWPDGRLGCPGCGSAGEPVPAAVDYVKVCDTFGAGFFYIPGTETCLDIGGRVRFRVQYADDQAGDGDTQTLRFRRADARIDFDVRTSTEYARCVPSPVSVTSSASPSPTRAQRRQRQRDRCQARLHPARLLHAGLQGDVANGDVLYGDNSAGYQIGDSDLVGMTILADDLGGGFYAGVGVYSGRAAATTSSGVTTRTTTSRTSWSRVLSVSPASPGWHRPLGRLERPRRLRHSWRRRHRRLWRSVEHQGHCRPRSRRGLQRPPRRRLPRRRGRPLHPRANSFITLAGALSYGFSDAATVYTGVRYDIATRVTTSSAPTLGVDYTIVDGLVGTAEVSYADTGDDDAWVRPAAALAQLVIDLPKGNDAEGPGNPGLSAFDWVCFRCHAVDCQAKLRICDRADPSIPYCLPCKLPHESRIAGPTTGRPGPVHWGDSHVDNAQVRGRGDRTFCLCSGVSKRSLRAAFPDLESGSSALRSPSVSPS